MDAEPFLDPDEQAKGRVGQLLSAKWRLERLLGVGGMAAVYAAKHENNDRAAAIKVLHLEASLNQEVKRRFLREGYIANKVKHPGAVAVLDDGVTDDGAAYIVMELCQGETLQEHLDKHGLADEATVLRWVDGLLDVLALAHKEGIVHRDLKPDNVFVLESGGVKVLDFGIARIRGGLSDLKTQAGMVLGTPAFMPPEQARGQSQRVDGRSDLWAVGAIMLAALTGKRVHTAKSPQECLFLAMTEHAKDMIDFAPEISPKVAAIIDKALEFEPEQRWDDAVAMQTAVRGVLSAFVRDPTVLAKPVVKPAWPPPPVLPGPRVAPRLSSPEIAADEAPRRPSKAPTKIEPPSAPQAAAALASDEIASLPEQAAAAPVAEASTGITPISTPPPPKHLQGAGRSLEAGSPLLPSNRKRRRWGLAALVLSLIGVSFGAALAIQHSQPVRIAFGLEAEADVAELDTRSEPVPVPSMGEPAAAPEPFASAEPTPAEPLEALDAGAPSVADAGAHLVGSSAQRPKQPTKPKLPPKKPPKKKRHR